MANILLVDDDKSVHKILEKALIGAGHSVTNSYSGKDAWTALNHDLFHLLISDIKMPNGISGFNLIALVRGLEHLRNLPILLISGLREKSSVLKAVQTGADDYLVKPIDLDILMAKVESLLELKPMIYSFAETAIAEMAAYKIPLKIVGISEQGLSLLSPWSFESNSKIKIESPFFEQIGISTPFLRIEESKETQTSQQERYAVRAHFIGLDVRELHLIRRFLLNRKPPAKVAA